MINLDDRNDIKEIELSLKEVIDILKKSKVFIISATLIITLLGSLYSSQQPLKYQSSVLVEVGSFEVFEDENFRLIENLDNLIRELKVYFYFKKGLSSNNLVFTAFENRLLEISLTTSSPKDNVEKLNEIKKFIESRHLNLLVINNPNTVHLDNFAKKINSLTNRIATLKSTLYTKTLSKLELNKNHLSKIEGEEDRIERLIKLTTKVIDDEENNLNLLANEPNLKIERATKSPTFEELIYSYKKLILDLEFQLRESEFDKNKLLNEKNDLENLIKLIESGDIDHKNTEVLRLIDQKIEAEKTLESISELKINKTMLIQEKQPIQINQSRNRMILLLSFVFGLLVSLVITLIRYFVLKAYNEN